MVVAVRNNSIVLGAASKALNDFVFFCKHCFYIRDKQGKIGPFVLNSSQRKIWELIKEQMDARRPVRVVVLKPRQIGISTFAAAFLLWEMLRRPVFAVTMAHKDEAARRVYGILQFAFEKLPLWLTTTIGVEALRNNSTGMELSHTRSQLDVYSAAGAEPGRAGTIQLVHLSETAFYPDADRVLASLFSAVPETPGTVVLEESTGAGATGYFPERYNRAKQGLDGYKVLFIPWYEHEEYRLPVPPGEKPVCPPSLRSLYEAGVIDDEQLWWRQTVLASKYAGREELFTREFPATEEEALFAEAANYFPPALVEKRLREIEGVPYEEGDVLPAAAGGGAVFVPRRGAELRVFRPPTPGRMYVIGADAASGVAGRGWANYSSADVLDVETGEQVAHLHLLGESGEFARRLRFLGEYYNQALIAVETTDGHGLAVAMWLRDAGYPSLYQRQVYDRVGQMWVSRLGWHTNARTKPFMLDILRSAFLAGKIVINDERTLREMLAFVRDENGKLGAAAGAQDDCVMSLSIAVMAWRDYGPHLAGSQRPPEPEEAVVPQAVNVRMRSREAEPLLHPELGAYL